MAAAVSPINTELKRIVERILRRDDISQADFGKRAGLAQSTVHNILNGRKPQISLETFARFAKGAGLRPDQIGRLVLKVGK